MQTGKTCGQKWLRSSTVNCSYLLMLREVNVCTPQIWPWSAAFSGKAFWWEVLMCPLGENRCSCVVLRVEWQTKSCWWATPDCDATMPTVEDDSHSTTVLLAFRRLIVQYASYATRVVKEMGEEAYHNGLAAITVNGRHLFLNCPIFQTFSAGPSVSFTRALMEHVQKKEIIHHEFKTCLFKDVASSLLHTSANSMCDCRWPKRELLAGAWWSLYAISSTPNLIGPMPLYSSRFRQCAYANCSEFASVGFHAQLPQLCMLGPPPSGSMNIFVTYSESSIKSKLYKTNWIVLRKVVIASVVRYGDSPFKMHKNLRHWSWLWQFRFDTTLVLKLSF